MADFPDSTLLPKIHPGLSRRALMREMAAAGALLAVPSAGHAASIRPLDAELLNLHQQWLNAKASQLENCDEEERLCYMARDAMPDIPVGLAVLNRSTGARSLMTDCDIELFSMMRPKGWADATRKAISEYHAARKQVRDSMGLTAAEQRVEESDRYLDQVEQAICGLPAQTIPGILAKLNVVRDYDDEWWNIMFEAAHADLQRLIPVHSPQY